MSWTVEQSSCIFSVTIAGFRQIILSSHAEILYANIR